MTAAHQRPASSSAGGERLLHWLPRLDHDEAGDIGHAAFRRLGLRSPAHRARAEVDVALRALERLSPRGGRRVAIAELRASPFVRGMNRDTLSEALLLAERDGRLLLAPATGTSSRRELDAAIDHADRGPLVHCEPPRSVGPPSSGQPRISEAAEAIKALVALDAANDLETLDKLLNDILAARSFEVTRSHRAALITAVGCLLRECTNTRGVPLSILRAEIGWPHRQVDAVIRSLISPGALSLDPLEAAGYAEPHAAIQSRTGRLYFVRYISLEAGVLHG